MKTIISLFLSIIFLSACNQSDDLPSFWEQQPDNGKVSLTRAGKKWRGVSMVAKPYDHKEGWGLSIGKIQRNENHGIYFHNIPESIGTHAICVSEKITNEQPERPPYIGVSYTAIIPDDLRLAGYACLEDAENHFTISDYDPDTREITGSFRVKLYLAENGSTKEQEEFITFESEEFTVQIRED